MISNNKIYNIIYFLGVFLLQIRYFDTYSNLIVISNIFSSLFLILGIIFISIKILSIREKRDRYFLKIFLILIGGVIYLKSNNIIFLIFILVALGAEDLDKRSVVKFLFFTNLLYIIINVFGYFLQMIFDPENLYILFVTKNQKIVQRFTFNFIHSNTFAAFVFWVYMMYVYLYDNRNNKFINMLITLGILIFIYFTTYSYTTCLMMILFIILYYFYSESKMFYMKFSKFIMQNLTIIIFLVMLSTIIFYDFSLVQMIDELLTSRVTLARFAYERYGIGIIGMNVLQIDHPVVVGDYILGNFMYLDGGYYNLILRSGVIASVIFLYYVKGAMKKFFDNKERKNIVFLTICAIFAISETIALNPMIAFPLAIIFEKRRKKEID